MDWTDADQVEARLGEVEQLEAGEWALTREKALAAVGLLVAELRAGRETPQGWPRQESDNTPCIP